ncbi:MAG: hypothetical protein KA978_20680 [Deltaproteobacteria bacterium]|nr:hypothetical protein [Deltaproteobacteria bacterium]
MARERRWMVVAFVACALLAAAVWRWSGALPTGGIATRRPEGEDASLTANRSTPSGTASPGARDAGSFRPPSATVHDRAVRDDIRARILAAWLSALPEVDSGFATCLRESMYTVAFRPPPGRGSLRVRYPFIFRPEDSGAGR